MKTIIGETEIIYIENTRGKYYFFLDFKKLFPEKTFNSAIIPRSERIYTTCENLFPWPRLFVSASFLKNYLTRTMKPETFNKYIKIIEAL